VKRLEEVPRKTNRSETALAKRIKAAV